MAIGDFKDVEQGHINSLEDLEIPLIYNEKENNNYDETNKGSIAMVLLSTLVAVCGSFQFGACAGYSAPTQSAIMEDLNLSPSQYSMFGSILAIGAMPGAITSGWIADYIGRKGAMRMATGFCIIGWLTIYLSRECFTLDMGRFLTGCGIGVFSYVVPIFIAEISPKNHRGALAALNLVWNASGAAIVYLLGSLISWRSLALTGIIPCIFLLVGLFFIPESPRWLAKIGRDKEFKVALQKLRGGDADITQETDEIEDSISILQALPKTRFLDLFQKQYIRVVFIAVALMFFQQFGGTNGIAFYANQIFVSAGLSSGTLGSIAYGFVQIPITIVGALLMDKTGRKPLTMISAAGTFVGCFMTGTSFLLKSHGLMLEWAPILAVAGVLIFISAYSIGMGAVPWVIMSEVFPLNIKGIGGSSVAFVNWFGAWIVTYTFNFLISWSSSGIFYLFSGFSLMTILFVAKYVPETKGKTLEEIQESINS